MYCIRLRVVNLNTKSFFANALVKGKVCTRSSQVAHTAGAYSLLGVLLLPPGWNASPSQVHALVSVCIKLTICVEFLAKPFPVPFALVFVGS